jgi:hypothetical protein
MWAILLVAALAFLPVAASATTIQIQFSGLDLVYNGSSIYDATSSVGGTGNPAVSDSLITMAFLKDGVLQGILTSNIYADVAINGVSSIPVTGGTVYSTGGGIFDLLTSTAGWGLALDVANGFQVNYNGTSVNFLGSGLASNIPAQSLPFGLAIGDPVQISFSTGNLTNVSSNGVYLTGFHSSGTGEVAGTVPEPGTLLLLGTGLVGIASFARRRMRK